MVTKSFNTRIKDYIRQVRGLCDKIEATLPPPLVRTEIDRVRCPKCNSADQRYRRKTGTHLCRQCGNEWEAGSK